MQIPENVGDYLGQKVGERARKRVESFSINIVGLENLTELCGTSFLLASNHVRPKSAMNEQSQLGPDVFVLERIVREYNNQRLIALAKADSGFWLFGERGKEVQRQFERPVKAAVIGVGMIPVHKNPGSVNIDMIRGIKAAIVRHDPLVIFPEGVWKDRFDPTAPLDPGAAYLALKFGLPILPTFISNVNTWESGQLINVYFGGAIQPTGKTQDFLTAEMRENISSLQRLDGLTGRSQISSLFDNGLLPAQQE